MITLPSCYENTLYPVKATFADPSGTLTDPSTITVKFAQGQLGFPVTTWVYGESGSITRSGTGVYVAELDTTDLPGTWVGEWVGTGACQVTQPFGFTVNPLPL